MGNVFTSHLGGIIPVNLSSCICLNCIALLLDSYVRKRMIDLNSIRKISTIFRYT